MEQLIIAVGRESGSGGHEIAKRLSEQYQIPFYDKNILQEIAYERDLNHEELSQFDEKNRNKLIYRTVRGMNSSPEHNVAELQFDYLRQMANDKKSFVVVGRCAETVLKYNKNMISVFVTGDEENKLARIMETYGTTKEESLIYMNSKNKKRKKYHNTYCTFKWGDSRNYDLSINSSKTGIEGTVKIIADYVDEARKK